MLVAHVIRAVATIAALAIGIAWAAPAAAIGILAGAGLALTVGGAATAVLRIWLQPDGSQYEREQPLFHPVCVTVWMLGVAAVCGYVAHLTHDGVYDGALGYAFLPSVVPFALLAFTATRLLVDGDGIGGIDLDLDP